ncbi:LPXTG cell wall anchor domain-containing protein [Actinoplanes sp. G11-F43]|uniref:LPXTG cell wall anchor domain-containing protein n=1 Tax=Actinoplanes sp. G11-F43 TaxID=3424130 RepID=UPI003D33803C
MKNPLRVRHVVAALAGALLGLTALTNPAGATGGNHGGSKGKLFTHTFTIKDGVATATITPKRDVKAEKVTLVSYFAPKPNFAVPQYVFESKTGVLEKKNGTVELQVNVPDCNTQVDLFFGGEDDVLNPLDGNKRYGDKKLGEKTGLGGRSEGPAGFFNGGKQDCVQPAVQPVALCDGTVDLQLSNNGALSKFDVTFRVTANGIDKTVKVPAGQGETVKIPAGAGTIKVTEPRMKEFTYTWSRPETCVPVAVGQNDCTTVTVTVTNPEGNTPAKSEVTYGTETKTVTVAPGTSEPVTFPAGEATTATVSYPEITGTEPVTVPVEKADCPSPSPSNTPSEEPPASPSASPSAPASESPSASASTSTSPVATTPVAGEGGGDGELPLTGSAAASVAGGAFLLLVAGGVFFFLARRRKINFTA